MTLKEYYSQNKSFSKELQSNLNSLITKQFILTYDSEEGAISEDPDGIKFEIARYLDLNFALEIKSYTYTTLIFHSIYELKFWIKLMKLRFKNRKGIHYTISEIANADIEGNFNEKLNEKFIKKLYPKTK